LFALKDLSFGAFFMDYMMRALELAAQARGQTSPNPMVGAILVKDGQVVGSGYHQRAGGPHAEVLALREAGERARGATLYVTLEPCCHFGRTPPCTQALIAAGVAEVHAAMTDPNPLMSGSGLAELKQAGMIVVAGEHEAEARLLNEVFLTYMTKRRPFVIVKYAMSLDGKIATRTGASRGLTGAAWLSELHTLRSQVDAILVGVNTVLADDPLLTARTGGDDVRQPLRIVLDSTLRTPLGARMLDAATPGKTLIATTAQASREQAAALRERGAEVIALGEQRVDITALLRLLGERSISSLLVEGGSQVIASFVAAGLVDKVMAIVAPLLIGGDTAPTPVGGSGAATLADALRLENIDVRQVGPVIVITGYPAT
jgi:diaminohydroxyphosphoribosylaminopyrimidine deaminase/5-amino-6-(5-phosphoribosylamino)uracil reductase